MLRLLGLKIKSAEDQGEGENAVTTGESGADLQSANTESSRRVSARTGTNYGLKVLYEPPGDSKTVVE